MVIETDDYERGLGPRRRMARHGAEQGHGRLRHRRPGARRRRHRRGRHPGVRARPLRPTRRSRTGPARSACRSLSAASRSLRRLLVGDENGVVVVPRKRSWPPIVNRAQDRRAKEAAMDEAVRAARSATWVQATIAAEACASSTESRCRAARPLQLARHGRRCTRSSAPRVPADFELVTLDADNDAERPRRSRDCEVAIVASTPLAKPVIDAGTAAAPRASPGRRLSRHARCRGAQGARMPLALTPEGTTIGVAEHAVLLALAVCKRLPFADSELREGPLARQRAAPRARGSSPA